MRLRRLEPGERPWPRRASAVFALGIAVLFVGGVLLRNGPEGLAGRTFTRVVLRSDEPTNWLFVIAGVLVVLGVGIMARGAKMGEAADQRNAPRP